MAPDSLQRLLTELKRRKVTRVAVTYAVVGWVVVEVAATVFPLLSLPEWGPTLVLAFILLGFPVALILAWAFEVTPDGVQRTAPLESESDAATGGLRTSGLLFVAAVVAVAGLGGYAWGRFGTEDDGGATSGPIRSLAVLPLDNLTGDEGQAYFVDGMHDAMISELARIEQLTVLSRTSTLRYRETDRSLGEIARELGVEGLVEGSVFRAGDSVRITVQLVRGSPEEHLWTESYRGDISRALSLHSRVARAIAEEVRLTLSPEDETRLAASDSVDPRAQDAYLQGRAVWRTRQLDNLERAVGLMEEAVGLDSTFARGHAGLADAYVIWANYASETLRWSREKTLETYEKGIEAARRALELDPDLAQPHATLGYAAMMRDLDWSTAEREIRRALELNPSYAQAWNWLGDVLGARGRTAEAVEPKARAVELDPFSPLMHRDLGLTLLLDRRCDEAVGHLRRALELDPEHWIARVGLQDCAVVEGNEAEAVDQLLAAVEGAGVAGSDQVAAIRKAYETAGLDGIARMTLEIEEGPGAFDRALALVELERFDEAVAELRKGYENRAAPVILNGKAHPRLDPLRDRPDFQALMREMNLAG